MNAGPVDRSRVPLRNEASALVLNRIFQSESSDADRAGTPNACSSSWHERSISCDKGH
jgi:hypothetical protein